MLPLQTLVIYGLAFALPAAYLAYRHFLAKSSPPPPARPLIQRPLKSIMQAASENLPPPRGDPITTEQLKRYDGTDPTLPIYVAIKGTVFDVSHKADIYGKERSYHIFAGKDGSKGLGMSTLVEEHAVPDYSSLNEHDMGVLNQWHSFFTKRYAIVGKVADGPFPAPPLPGEEPPEVSISNL